MKDLCFVMVVDGDKYEGYIPFFLYFLYKAYPGADAVIYVKNRLKPAVKSQMFMLSKNLKDFDKKYSITESAFIGYPDSSDTIKTLRWTLSGPEGYKYIFIGDIDIFIVNETPSLLDSI
jgi:hypothetical protein